MLGVRGIAPVLFHYRVHIIQGDLWFISTISGEGLREAPRDLEPDPTDGATLGALLAALIEATAKMPDEERCEFMTEHVGNAVGLWLGGWIKPEELFAALLAAWKARPWTTTHP